MHHSHHSVTAPSPGDSTNGGVAAASCAYAASSALRGVSPSVLAATTSLHALLVAVRDLETDFRANAAALTAAAVADTPGTAPTDSNTSSRNTTAAATPVLLATLDHLAAATTQCDVHVGQQLAYVRRGVTTLAQDVRGLSARFPSLQSKTPGTTGNNNGLSGSLTRTPQLTPKATAATPTSTRAAFQALSPMLMDSSSSNPASPPQRPNDAPPPGSPQLLPASASSAGRAAVGLGDSVRSLGSAASIHSPPVRPATRMMMATSSPTSAAVASPNALGASVRSALSPGRAASTAATASSGHPATPATPSLASLCDRTMEGPLPAAQLPHPACAETVKRHLMNCVEWPPRPREGRVRPLPLRRPTWMKSTMKEEECAREDGVSSPVLVASRTESANGGTMAATSKAPQHRTPHTHHERSQTDEFLRRLTEESPYDFSMLRPPSGLRSITTSSTDSDGSHRRPRLPGTRDNGDATAEAQRRNEHGVKEGNERRATLTSSQHQSQQRRLSTSGAARHVVMKSSGSGSGKGKGKRVRSDGSRTSTREKEKDETQLDASLTDAPPRDVRHGRPTLLESVDALVLSQLRADGVSLTASMISELRGCAVSVDEKTATEEVVDALDSSVLSNRYRTIKEDVARDQHDQGPCDGAAAVDFASVLQEMRVFAHEGGAANNSNSNSSRACSAAEFPAVPPHKTQASLTKRRLKKAAPPEQSLPLPLTTDWLTQIRDFCTLLESVEAFCDGSKDNSDDGDEGSTVSLNEEDDEASATREHVSPHRRRPRVASAASSTAFSSSSSASTSNTAAAASASDYSIADELSSSAEEAELSDHHQRVQRPVTVPHESRHSSSDSDGVRHTAPSVPAPDTEHRMARRNDRGSATRDSSNTRVPLTASEDFWVEDAGRPITGVTPAIRTRATLPAPGVVLTPGARAFAQRQRAQTLQLRAVLQQPATERATTAATEEGQPQQPPRRPRGNRRIVSRHTPPCATAEKEESEQWEVKERDYLTQLRAALRLQRQAAQLDETQAPHFSHAAAAQHLRALCDVLQTDLMLLHALQQVATLLTVFPVAAAAAEGEEETDTRAAATCSRESLGEASKLVLSLQAKSKMQQRVAQEEELRSITAAAAEADREKPTCSSSFLSRAHSKPFSDAGSPTESALTSSASPAPPLILSAQHPMSALGYAPVVQRLLHAAAAVPGPASKAEEGEAATARNTHVGVSAAAPCASQAKKQHEQLVHFLVAVTPYLLAWQRPGNTPEHYHNGAKNTDSATAAAATAVPLLPLPVWVYLESLTSGLLEAARKLDALYQLYMLLATESTMAEVGIAASSPGGTAELLVTHVRHHGRAAAAAQQLGVTGARLPQDNTLEKFVTPISSYLLTSLNTLESRHLLHHVFHNVHLSDVMARRRACRAVPPSSPSSTVPRPPPHAAAVVAAPRRVQADEGAEVDEGDGMGSFALPPGDLSSSPALRSAAGTQWSMRDAEQQQHEQSPEPAQNLSDAGRSNDDDDSDSMASPRTGLRRFLHISGPGRGERRHVIIEGLVRYLTSGSGDPPRRSGSRAGADGGSAGGRNTARSEDEGSSPPGKPNEDHPSSNSHHHSGLTLDVPHTATLLKEQDVRLGLAASNDVLLRATERGTSAEGPLVTSGRNGKQSRGADEKSDGCAASELSAVSPPRRYYSSRAAAFVVPAVIAAVSTPSTAVQCRWQTVFQSTMCFCPVTRRRCLDPLVCGALLQCSSLSPHEITCGTASEGVSSAGGGTGVGAANVSVDTAMTAVQFPSTIRTMRGGPERSPPVRAVGGDVGGGAGGAVRRGVLHAPRLQGRPSERTREPPDVPGASTTTTATSSSSPVGTRQPSVAQAVSPAIRMESVSAMLPNFLLGRLVGLPERVVVSRVMTQAPTALYGASSAFATRSAGSAGPEEEEGEERHQTRVLTEGDVSTAAAVSAAVAESRLDVRHTAVSVALETPSLTRNLLSSPDRSHALLLNPPTLLECGHVVAHKTFLDLRTTGRRSTRAAAAAAAAAGGSAVVSCPYCSKITATKDAVTLTYLY